VFTCRDEVTCFNLGLPLPHAQWDAQVEDLVEADLGEDFSVIVNGRRQRLPHSEILEMVWGVDETNADQGDHFDVNGDGDLSDQEEPESSAGSIAAEEGESEYADTEGAWEEVGSNGDDAGRVKLGRVRLLSSADSFQAAFARFAGDELNGFSELKLQRLGQEAIVDEVYGDRTVTCLFEDEASLDFPWEAIAEQINVTGIGIDHTETKYYVRY
jgi:hypothetical protein